MYKISVLLKATDQPPFRYQGEEAAAEARTRFPTLSGYVQTSPLADQPEVPFAGALELYFASVEALSIGDVDALLTDGTTAACVVTGAERVVMCKPEFRVRDSIKGVYPFRRKPGLNVEAFQHYWWHTHGPIAAQTQAALAYTQLHVLPGCYETGEPVFDGITEIYWPDRAAVERAVASRQMIDNQGADAANFVDLQSVVLFYAEEDILIAP